MARCTFATWTPIRATSQQPQLFDKTQIILHTIVGSARQTIADWQRSNHKESTFVIANDGTLYQCMDSAQRADANLGANRSAISVETEDRGAGRGSWDPGRVWVPWTDAQLATIMRLLTWAHQTHGIPLRRCASPTAPGVGYHTMWGAPSPWTPVAKCCPGPARIRQFDEILMPFLEGRPRSDGASIASFTQRPIELVPAEVRRPLIVDRRYPLSSRRSTRRAPAGRTR